jgi:predicted patatin/cPLA2 family phospholipase
MIDQAATVSQRLREKARLLASDDQRHLECRTAIVACGGGIRGAFGAGVMIGLKKLGLSEVFDFNVGVSAGAANLAYLLSGQPELGTTIYYEEMVTRQFINPWRLWRIADIDYVERVLRDSRKKLDEEAVRRARGAFYIGVTSANGNGELIDAKGPHDIIRMVKASIALPVVYNKLVQINGGEFIDGDISLALPVAEVKQQFAPTDLVLVINRPFDGFKDDPLAWWLRAVSFPFLLNLSKGLRAAYLAKNKNHNARLSAIHSGEATTGLNVAVIAPHYEISLATSDGGAVRALAELGTEMALQILG